MSGAFNLNGGPAHDGASPWSRAAGLVLPVAMISGVLVLIVPIPAEILDLLISANLTLSVLVLLTTLTIGTPLQFSSFPTVLLATALSRLMLNFASTRLILSKGPEQGLDAAGGVIRAFGEFVAGGQDQVVVGAIMFLILFVIQFVVITKGATRIGEVAARFMLDGLPGRQMAIDADLHAGLIDQHEAQRRRELVYRQADFFAGMDGAGKFVRGDAVAGLVIAVINIVGGLVLGVFRHGMSPSEAVEVFTKLTIGDGLVSQIPAFLTSLAAGLIVTRSMSETHLGRDVARQLLGRPDVLLFAAAMLGLLALTPLPMLPLLVLALGLVAVAVIQRRNLRARAARQPEPADRRQHRHETRAALQNPTASPTAEHHPRNLPNPAVPNTQHPHADRVEDLLYVDPLELAIGYRLIPLADPNRQPDLLEGIRALRTAFARELGLIVPQVRIRDDLALAPFEYRFKIRDVVVGGGLSHPGRLLVVPPPGAENRRAPAGRDALDPVTGRPAVWIHADGREVAELAGCEVRDASSVILAHFREILAREAERLLNRATCERLLERVRAHAPELVNELVPAQLRVAEVHRVLQNLLRERVSIRDLETILEALAEHAPRTRDPNELTEHARRALGRSICQRLLGPDGRLRLVTLAPRLEQKLVEAARVLSHAGLESPRVLAEPRDAADAAQTTARNAARALARHVRPLLEAEPNLALACLPILRPFLRALTRPDLPALPVLGIVEIPADLPVEILATLPEHALDQDPRDLETDDRRGYLPHGDPLRSPRNTDARAQAGVG